MKGIDYTDGNLRGHTIITEGYSFVGRYLSNSTWKNITLREVEDLQFNNIKIILVWETTVDRTLNGYSAGLEDAQESCKLAASLGHPRNKPIYFAVDDDMSPGQLGGQVAEYFKGVNSILGVDQTGVYGGLSTVRTMLDCGLVSYAWQTVAWSKVEGVTTWDDRVNIRQYNTGTNMVGNVSCDLNESMTDDFGQW